MKKQIGAWFLSIAILFAALPQKSWGAAPLREREAAAAACLAFYPAAEYGTEWSLLGLIRSETSLPAGYVTQYCTRLAQTLKEKQGVLHGRKYTEYARVALAVTAAGQDARSFGGYSLIAPLGEGDAVLRQGVNGAIFALLALDCGNYPMPAAKAGREQTTRGTYVRAILSAQTKDGGFALSGERADADVTAMALTALSPYQGRMSGVAEAVEQGIACLSRMQKEDGGFSSSVLEDGTVSGEAADKSNCESTAQVLTALCTLGISVKDPRFVKGEETVVQALLKFQRSDGSFAHQSGGGASEMATEQALYALAALERAEAGKSPLYDMADTYSAGGKQGLPGKRQEVTARPAAAEGKTFSDIIHHPARGAIETLTAYGVLNGKSSAVFDPDATMTRGEFSTAVVRALGLTPRESSQFDDVTPGSWYSGFVGTAFSYGITRGTASRRFTPGGVITREEAAVMICRTAALCGLTLSADEEKQEQVLMAYSDGASVSSWAREAMAVCCAFGWVQSNGGRLLPQTPILRGEVAEILANLLWEAELLAG
jgi:hypothetical protein